MRFLDAKGFVLAALMLALNVCVPPSGSSSTVSFENLSGEDVEVFLPPGESYRERGLTPRFVADGATIHPTFPMNVCLRGDFRVVSDRREVLVAREELCSGDSWQVAVDADGKNIDSLDSHYDSVFRRRPPIVDVDSAVPRDPTIREREFDANIDADKN